MFVEFKVANFLSFKNLVSLSLLATSQKEHFEENVFTIGFPQASRAKPLNLLKSAAIYGANASGKSNFVKAIAFMKRYIMESFSTPPEGKIPVPRFLFSTEMEKKPSRFELIFIYENVRYRYGFEIDNYQVLSEWLYYIPKTKEALLFVREGEDFDLGNSFREGKGLEKKTRHNALFLSTCAQFNGPISTNVMAWFRRLNTVSGLDDRGALDFSFERIQNPKYNVSAVNLMKIADVGIVGILAKQTELSDPDVPDSVREIVMLQTQAILRERGIEEPEKAKHFLRRVLTMHPKYDDKKKRVGEVPLDLFVESEGTQKLLAFFGPLTDTLENGKVLVIDELDARFHPLISQFLIQLFNSKKNNPNNAQLIFTTHDTNLLTNKLFRRDQIWFTEKDRQGATDLYSLADYKVRPDATFNKDYILGKYGAIPFLGDPRLLLGIPADE